MDPEECAARGSLGRAEAAAAKATMPTNTLGCILGAGQDERNNGYGRVEELPS